MAFSNFIAIDACIWQYMNKRSLYLKAIEKVTNSCCVSTEMNPADSKLKLVGDNEDEVIRSRREMEVLVDHCRQLVKVHQLSQPAPQVYQRILEADPGDFEAVVIAEHGNVCVAGTELEIKETLRKFDSFPVDNDNRETAAPPSTMQSSTGANAASSLSNATTEQRYIDLEHELWKYMQKNPVFADKVKHLKQDMFVDVVESGAESSTAIRLVFSGPIDDVSAAFNEAKSLVERCQKDCHSVHIRCTNNLVFSKIKKFLPVINKCSGYVSASADEMVVVTGTEAEVHECRQKLEKLGLEWKTVAEDGGQEPDEIRLNEDDTVGHQQLETDVADPRSHMSSDLPSFLNKRFQDDRFEGVEQSEFTGNERMDETSAEFKPRDSNLGMSSARPEANHNNSSATCADTTSTSSIIELPVPVEASLWSFIEKRRRRQLQELRDIYNVSVRSSRVDDSFVILQLVAESTDMLECGQDALIAIIEQLRQSVIISGIDTGIPAGEMSQEVCEVLSELSEDSDAVVDVVGSRIVIVGTNEAASECQQKITALIQQVAAQSGQVPGLQSQLGAGLSGFGGVNLRNLQHAMAGGRQGSRPGGMPGNFGGPRCGHEGHGTGGGAQVSDLSSLRDTASASLGGPGGAQGDRRDEKSVDSSRDTFSGSGMNPVGPRAALTGATSQNVPSGRSGEMEETHQEQTSRGILKHSSRQMTKVPDNEEESVVHRGGQKSVSSPPTNTAEHPSVNGIQLNGEKDGSHHHGQEEKCDVCAARHDRRNGKTMCAHAFCVSCVQSYFSRGEMECPVCGIKDEAVGRKLSQPADGRMLTTFNNGFKLPGFETSSRGTVVVVYSFPAGYQSEDMQNPGRKYSGTTLSAFFPMTSDGMKLVSLVQQAFDKRLLFTVRPSSQGGIDELDLNGISHKTSVFGGPQLGGYPDTIYLQRLHNELAARGVVH